MPALAIVAIVLALNAWTISILVEAAERHQTFDVGSLLARLPGRLGLLSQYACNAVLWLTMFLCLVGYIIVMVDCLQASAPRNFIGADPQNPHRTLYVMLASLCVLPLCFLDQRRLAFTSILAVIANANIFSFLMTLYTMEDVDARPSVCYFGLAKGSVAMVSAMMQVVVIQMCALPMYGELENRTPAKFNQIVAVSFGILMLLCCGFGVAGYATFGSTVNSNILVNLPNTQWGHVSRVAAATAVAAVFPMILGAMVAPLSSSQFFGSYHQASPQATSGFTICLIVFVVMATAVSVDHLGFLNVVNGAISMGAFVALAPSLVGLYLLGPKSSNYYWRAAMYTLIVGGLVMSALGLILTDNYASSLHSACAWPVFS